ncbi:uncharacterized protein LOC142330984 isoform X1 [Lycorma delicatula]|uniref:uncharacterized protein LOC142330984 isoform X1 n=1 Tax=Lycorma delicatula TaxID=130591 RepID=UPI003F50F62A
MCWQVVSGVFLTTIVSLCLGYPNAFPHIPAFQHQRQFYYAPLPAAAASSPQFPFAAPPSSNYVYFAPQTQPQQAVQPSRLVSPAPSALRYPAPTTAVAAGNGQYVVVYPGGTVPGGSVVLVGRQGEGEGEGEGEGSGWTDFFGQIGEYFSWPFSPSVPVTPGESPAEGAGAGASAGSAPVPVAPAKPEKVEATNENQPEVEKLPENAIPQAQRLLVVGQPQFFGHFAALQKANPANLPSAANGAVSSFLLLRNGNAQQIAEDPVLQADGPGSAALAYQRLLVLSKKQQKEKEAAEAGSVTVDVKEGSLNSSVESSSTSPSSNEESENVDADEEGPSIAQAKPQAISLAGRGGVAAAAPVGTAVVGPGGMALSAPSATAVAGPTAGTPISIAPANKAAKTYFLAKQNPQYLFPYKP